MTTPVPSGPQPGEAAAHFSYVHCPHTQKSGQPCGATILGRLVLPPSLFLVAIPLFVSEQDVRRDMLPTGSGEGFVKQCNYDGCRGWVEIRVKSRSAA